MNPERLALASEVADVVPVNITTQNLRSVLPWGVIVTLGFALSATTGLLGLIVIFPLLGHGTWHAWVALRPEGAQGQ